MQVTLSAVDEGPGLDPIGQLGSESEGSGPDLNSARAAGLGEESARRTFYIDSEVRLLNTPQINGRKSLSCTFYIIRPQSSA